MGTQPAEASDIQLTWTFGDRLRKVRRLLGLSQEDFAKMLDATPQALGAWELDVNTPRNVVAIAKRLEIATGVAAGWTLGLQTDATLRPPTGDAGEGPRKVRRQGLEPRTRYVDATASEDGIAHILLADSNPDLDDSGFDGVADVIQLPTWLNRPGIIRCNAEVAR